MQKKAIILVVIIGLISGVVGAFGVALIGTRSTFSELNSLPPIADVDNSTEEIAFGEARASIILGVRPDARAQTVSAEDTVFTGIALTSDGLVAAYSAPKTVKGLTGVPLGERLTLPLDFAKDSKGKTFFDKESGLTFFRVTPPAGESINLKPISLPSFERITPGRTLIAFSPKGEITLHRALDTNLITGSAKPISSEAAPEFIVTDATLPEGALVFEQGGKFVGVAQKNGSVFPAEFIGNMVRQYLENKTYTKTTLGINYLDLHGLVRTDRNLPSAGLLLTMLDALHPAVVAKSPADKAKLKPGDILSVFDGQRINGGAPFQILLQRYRPATEVDIEILRANKTEKMKVVLE